MSKNTYPAAYALIDRDGNAWCAYSTLNHAKHAANLGDNGPYKIQLLDQSTIDRYWTRYEFKEKSPA